MHTITCIKQAKYTRKSSYKIFRVTDDVTNFLYRFEQKEQAQWKILRNATLQEKY